MPHLDFLVAEFSRCSFVNIVTIARFGGIVKPMENEPSLIRSDQR
jgi:hypothetical protein